MNPLVLLNAAACAVLFWIAGSFLLAHDRAEGWRQLVLQLGLVLLMVGSMIGAVAAFREGPAAPWWVLTGRVGAAIAAVCLYDLVFGIAEQTRHTLRHLLGTPARIRAWWRRSLEQAHARNASTTRR